MKYGTCSLERTLQEQMVENSDEILWQRAVSGDSDAFGVIFERHAKRVYNHCFRRVASWAVAEDLTSIVFLEAWKKRDAVQFVEHCALPWLLGVATNVCRNTSRSLRRYHGALGRLPLRPLDEDETDDVIAKLDAETEMKKVLKQLAGLSQKDREVLELSTQDGMDYESIAVALNIPVGTVRSRLSRARVRLRSASENNIGISIDLRRTGEEDE